MGAVWKYMAIGARLECIGCYMPFKSPIFIGLEKIDNRLR